MAEENVEFDLNQKIASLEREIHSLLMKIEKLEATGNHQRVILELKEREIWGLKQKLEELDGAVIKYSEWQKEKDMIYMVKDELSKRVKEMLTKVSELEEKLEIQENVISQRLVEENLHQLFGVNVEWPMVATSVVVAITIGVLCYHRDGRKI
ncbi:uncharacterized protein LOC132638620 [Lycium barbarum]|uniref:uncharacterized protein LOC132638620 n=1 Tax=Lycium barbarum TaxID=112863 RepID=UPI00293F408A|nr:uncharacterized protein LOC132638620 [Lycium barbarum]